MFIGKTMNLKIQIFFLCKGGSMFFLAPPESGGKHREKWQELLWQEY